jgi:hypothetical protein
MQQQKVVSKRKEKKNDSHALSLCSLLGPALFVGSSVESVACVRVCGGEQKTVFKKEQ